MIRSLSVESGVPHTISSWQALFQIIAHQINLKFSQDEKRGIAGGSPAGIPYENPSHDESLEPTIRDAQKGGFTPSIDSMDEEKQAATNPT